MIGMFQSALETGETAELSQHLAADVALISDGGGKVNAIPEPLMGLEQVLGFINKAISRQRAPAEPGWKNSTPACRSSP